MSDAETVRDALQWRIDKTTLDDARAALARLESQNQALQERIEFLKSYNEDAAREAIARLQERAEKAEAEREKFYERTQRLMDEMLPLEDRIEELTAALNEAIGHLTSNEWKHDASSRRRTKAVKEATRALSPTQETDPADEPDDEGWDDFHRPRPTQETDPG